MFILTGKYLSNICLCQKGESRKQTTNNLKVDESKWENNLIEKNDPLLCFLEFSKCRDLMLQFKSDPSFKAYCKAEGA